MIGKKLAHFEITAKLGEGGMGTVWRAIDTTLDREVAIKVLPRAFATPAWPIPGPSEPHIRPSPPRRRGLQHEDGLISIRTISAPAQPKPALQA